MVLPIAFNITQNTNYKMHTVYQGFIHALFAGQKYPLITFQPFVSWGSKENETPQQKPKCVALQNVELIPYIVKPKTKMHLWKRGPCNYNHKESHLYHNI